MNIFFLIKNKQQENIEFILQYAQFISVGVSST